MQTMREFNLDEIVLDYSVYGRGNVNQARVAALTEIYAEQPEVFEPVRLWVDDGTIKLCDGFARYLAAKAAGMRQIPGFIDESIQSAKDAKRASMQHNTRDKDAIPKGRIDAYIIECFREGMTVREIKADINKTDAYISAVLKPFREMERWIRDLDIIRMHLAGYTSVEIGEELGMHEGRVRGDSAHLFFEKQMRAILDESRPDYVAIRNDRLGEHLLNPWEPPQLNFAFDILSGMDIVEHEEREAGDLYGSSYWSFATNSKHYGTDGYPGRIPGQIVEGLLYLYTNPFDNVYDPFCGGGTTIDVCKAYFRRYWGSDLVPLNTRQDIRQHDILSGPPKFFPRGYKMNLIMLDPPYWNQKKGDYSEDETNLANLSLDGFYEAIDKVLLTCKGLLAPDGVIALIIGPTQNGKRYDHAIDIAKRADGLGLELINRMIVPYSTQQTKAYHITQMREFNTKAEKNAQKRLCKRYRDLLVFQAC